MLTDWRLAIAGAVFCTGVLLTCIETNAQSMPRDIAARVEIHAIPSLTLGEELRLNLRCASPSYNFDLASQVQYRDGAISGEWTEASRNASGTIEGRAIGDRVEAAARGQNFSANLSLTTRGNRQTVSIRPEGAADVRAVSLSLERR